MVSCNQLFRPVLLRRKLRFFRATRLQTGCGSLRPNCHQTLRTSGAHSLVCLPVCRIRDRGFGTEQDGAPRVGLVEVEIDHRNTHPLRLYGDGPLQLAKIHEKLTD